MTFEDEMRAALGTFLVEAEEMLHDMEQGLLQLELAADDELVNSVFRAAHTLKGSAGIFGLDHIVNFAHVLESVLDRLRSHQVDATAELVGALLPCKDHLTQLVAGVAAGDSGLSADQTLSGEVLIARLQPFLLSPSRESEQRESGQHASGEHGLGSAVTGPATASAAEPSSDVDQSPLQAQPVQMHLSLRFGAESLRDGMDPISFISYLNTLGEVGRVSIISAFLPELDEMDAETCYLGFEVSLMSMASRQAVIEVFDFVQQDSDIRVLCAGDPVTDFADLVLSYGEHRQLILDILLASDIAPASQLAEALGSELPAQKPAAPQGGAPTPVAKNRESVPSEAQTIRVDAARLDRLIDTVGELVISGAGADLAAMALGEQTLRAKIAEVTRLIEGVRDDALRLRMVPIGTSFSRFQRVVRDVSASLGKEVTLSISGGETEVDKALVEHIADPLMHLVRNSLDHGIERPEVRTERGKPARGRLDLRARHDSGSIVVELADDGGGIDIERVHATALARGLIDENTVLSKKDTFGLIFEPGFSTATEVSALSGRGVGMDVVKRNVTALRGSIELDSEPGQGTTFTIRLPLTLAIIDGFMVGVGETTFVLPLSQVVECLAVPPGHRDRDYVDLRGELLPLIRLRSAMRMPGDRPRRENVVVVETAGVKTGLVVDSLKGEFQTVIKPLADLLSVAGIGGSTILGNGEVALIIDVAELIRSTVSIATISKSHTLHG